MFTLAQTVATAAADSVLKSNPLYLQGTDPVFGLKQALYTWLLAGVVALSVAVIMKVLYLSIKRMRIKDAQADLQK